MEPLPSTPSANEAPRGGTSGTDGGRRWWLVLLGYGAVVLVVCVMAATALGTYLVLRQRSGSAATPTPVVAVRATPAPRATGTPRSSPVRTPGATPGRPSQGTPEP